MGKKGPLWWRESDWLLRGSSAANQILLRHSGPILSISVCGEGLHLIRIILDLVVFKNLNITNHRFLTPQVPVHASRHQTINSSSSLLSYMTILDGFVVL